MPSPRAVAPTSPAGCPAGKWRCRRRQRGGCWISDGLAPRRAALQILRAVRRGTPFDAARDAALEPLADADRRLAHELAAGVLRARTGLDRSLAQHVRRGWDKVEDDLQDILRLAAYQMYGLSRVPTHAAVHTAVDLARAIRGERAAGFVNGVLRSLTRAVPPGDAGPAGDDAATARSLADAFSHPEWLVERWLRHYGEARTRALLAHNNQRPPLVIQPARWTRERLRDALDAASVPYMERSAEEGFVVSGGRVEDLPGFAEGGFIVQDPAQARVVRFAAFPAGSLVWDACAAPGGKAVRLAAAAAVIAGDRHRQRLARLAETVARAAPGVAVMGADATAPPFRCASIDGVVLDAPCSATGTMARHPDARWHLSPETITRLAAEQSRLLDGVADVIRPGGILVYATCSLEPEENAEQVDRFLARHPDFARSTPDLSIFPPDEDTDGAYAARLVRDA